LLPRLGWGLCPRRVSLDRLALRAVGRAASKPHLFFAHSDVADSFTAKHLRTKRILRNPIAQPHRTPLNPVAKASDAKR